VPVGMGVVAMCEAEENEDGEKEEAIRSSDMV
jgi:hypothetical protein